MTDTQRPTLVKMGDSQETVANKDEDIRGRKVIDRDGQDIGKIEALMVDTREHKVRFLQVSSGGFLGIGDHEVLIPVDAITSITDDSVAVDKTRKHIANGPKYDPDLVRKPAYYDDLYGYYGYAPFWGAGYIYPGFPYYV